MLGFYFLIPVIWISLLQSSYIYGYFLKHAHALELLKDHLYEGAAALDVGSGSGYLTACMAHMVVAKNNSILGLASKPPYTSHLSFQNQAMNYRGIIHLV